MGVLRRAAAMASESTIACAATSFVRTISSSGITCAGLKYIVKQTYRRPATVRDIDSPEEVEADEAVLSASLLRDEIDVDRGRVRCQEAALHHTDQHDANKENNIFRE
jgi:hypothetical protein